MTAISKILKNVGIFRDANGNIVEGKLASTAVVMTDGSTNLETRLIDDATACTTALTTAINMLKDGADGTTLPADRDNLKKLADALASTHALVDDFVHGGATDDGVMNRLVELVTQINANKDTIDGLLSDKINVSDIVDDLTTGGTSKVLSAEQGKALKALIDALQTNLNQQIASLHAHGNKAVLDTLTANHALASSKVVSAVPEIWPADVRSDGVLYLTV